MMKTNILLIILNIIFLLVAPFFALGLIRKTKAFWGGRKGVSIFQPIYDIVKLFKKDRVVSSTTSWIFNFAPIAIFTTTLFAGLLAPMFMGYSIVTIQAGFVVFSYILALGKFFSLLSAMDTGSSFEGMGASREACFTTIVEPAFFIILGSLVALNNDFTFGTLINIISSCGTYGILIILMAVLALFIMLLTETSRVPIDDPETHLELTMIHEVMVLDNSGVDLALITWASGMKMVILMSLILNLIIPIEMELKYSISLFIGLFILLAIIIGTVESAIARLRMSHVFEFIFVMSSFALVVASLVAVKIYGVI